MVTALLLEVHPVSAPFTADGLVPPPDLVSGGENDTLADKEHVTEPGAAPTYLGGLGVLAVAGVAALTIPTPANSNAATGTTKWSDRTVRLNAIRIGSTPSASWVSVPPHPP